MATVTATGGAGLTNSATFTITATNVVGGGAYTPAAGDMCVIMLETNATGAGTAFSQTAGTGTFSGRTGVSGTFPVDSSGSGPRTAPAWRVFAGGDSMPTFTCVNTGRMTWACLILSPSAGGALGIDTWGTSPVFDASGTSHTAPSETPGASGETSVVLFGFKAVSSGTTAITWTAPSGWGANAATGSAAGAASSASAFAAAGPNLSPPSPSSPGAAATNVSTIANNYQVLISETGGAVTGLPEVVMAPMTGA